MGLFRIYFIRISRRFYERRGADSDYIPNPYIFNYVFAVLRDFAHDAVYEMAAAARMGDRLAQYYYVAARLSRKIIDAPAASAG